MFSTFLEGMRSPSFDYRSNAGGGCEVRAEPCGVRRQRHPNRPCSELHLHSAGRSMREELQGNRTQPSVWKKQKAEKRRGPHLLEVKSKRTEHSGFITCDVVKAQHGKDVFFHRDMIGAVRWSWAAAAFVSSKNDCITHKEQRYCSLKLLQTHKSIFIATRVFGRSFFGPMNRSSLQASAREKKEKAAYCDLFPAQSSST